MGNTSTYKRRSSGDDDKFFGTSSAYINLILPPTKRRNLLNLSVGYVDLNFTLIGYIEICSSGLFE